MKSAFILVVAAMFAVVGCSSEKVSGNMNDMPTEVQNAVNNNFKSPVVYAKIEKNSMGTDEYEIRLADGTEVKYEGTQMEEVKVPHGQSVPETFIPAPVQSYVKEKHAGMSVVKIDKDKKGYEVKLSNGMELKFNPNGNFIKYDD